MTEEDHIKHDQESKERILKDVNELGCHLALVEGDGYIPSFTYTIGLYKNYNHPEIIIFGLKPQVMGVLLNHAKSEIIRGNNFETSRNYKGFLEGFEVKFLEVNEEHYPDFFGYAGWFYNMTWNFPVLQIVWSDKNNYWPWELDFNENWKFKQPLLDRNTDFKFLEERNLGVYTTHHVLDGKPILTVYHNADGDWQFHSEEDPSIEDAKLVTLEQLVKKDPTLNDLCHLGFGYRAWRESKMDGWKFEKEIKAST
jgi:hypothetical protein